MIKGWSGSKVRLVPLDKERHFASSLVWFNDPEVTAWLLSDWPLTRLVEEENFEQAMKDRQRGICFAVETLAGGEHIGYANIESIDWPSRVAYTGTVIGRRDLWGQGYGYDAALVRARYAFDSLGLRMLVTEAMADNEGSIRTHQKVGSRIVGRIPGRHWKRGAYRDAVMLALEREAFYERNGAEAPGRSGSEE